MRSLGTARQSAAGLLTVAADDADDDPEYANVASENRFHRVVGRFEPDAVWLAVETLERGLAVAEQRDDDLAVACRLLFVHDDVVPVGDLVLDHRLALHLEHEQLGVTEHLPEVDGLGLLDRLDRLA